MLFISKDDKVPRMNFMKVSASYCNEFDVICDTDSLPCINLYLAMSQHKDTFVLIFSLISLNWSKMVNTVLNFIVNRWIITDFYNTARTFSQVPLDATFPSCLKPTWYVLSSLFSQHEHSLNQDSELSCIQIMEEIFAILQSY